MPQVHCPAPQLQCPVGIDIREAQVQPPPLAGPALPHSSEHQWERRAHWAPLSFSPPALRSAPDFHRPPISDLVQSSRATLRIHFLWSSDSKTPILYQFFNFGPEQWRHPQDTELQSVTVPRIFSGTGTGTFFWDQFFPLPGPVLFFGIKFFRYRYRYFFPGPSFSGTGTGTIQKGAKFPGPGIPGTGMSHSACF